MEEKTKKTVRSWEMFLRGLKKKHAPITDKERTPKE